jgi:hypothetical protein
MAAERARSLAGSCRGLSGWDEGPAFAAGSEPLVTRLWFIEVAWLAGN